VGGAVEITGGSRPTLVVQDYAQEATIDRQSAVVGLIRSGASEKRALNGAPEAGEAEKASGVLDGEYHFVEASKAY